MISWRFVQFFFLPVSVKNKKKSVRLRSVIARSLQKIIHNDTVWYVIEYFFKRDFLPHVKVVSCTPTLDSSTEKEFKSPPFTSIIACIYTRNRRQKKIQNLTIKMQGEINSLFIHFFFIFLFKNIKKKIETSNPHTHRL